MSAYLTLLRPYLLTFKNIMRRPTKGGRTKTFFICVFTLVVWLLVFVFAVKVLNNLKAGGVIGEILCQKFMGLLWVAATALLIFSALISSLSSFFLAKDLGLAMAAPVSLETVFWARGTQCLLTSAWMPAAFMLPIFIAYGFVFKAGLLYYLLVPLTALPLLAGTGFISQIIIIFLVNLLPARRTKDVMSLLAIVIFCALYMAFRLMRPEELVNPQSFMNTAAYLASMDAPSSSFLPTQWAVEILWPHLTGKASYIGSGKLLALLWATAAAIGVLASYVASFFYWSGYNKSVEGAGRQKTVGGMLNFFTKIIGSFMQPERRALVVKDIKIFFRDHTQWSQLLLLAALLIIYVYNFSVLNLKRFPLEAFALENMFAFLNIGLVALVSSTLALRFAFPSISGEGFAYWIIKAAPLSLKKFINIKLWLWLPPIWVIAVGLIILSNHYLNVGYTMNAFSIALTAIMTPSLCALAIGLGAIHPRFETENLAQVPTGYGGLVYMVTSSLCSVGLIALSSWPIIVLLNIERGRGSWSILKLSSCFGLVILVIFICVLLFFIPLKKGCRALAGYDDATEA